MLSDNAILDRSIYEDHYFASKIHDQGRISDLEFEIYSNILAEMMKDIDGMPKKAPDVMVYLKGSFETALHRILERGRSFEIDPDLKIRISRSITVSSGRTTMPGLKNPTPPVGSS